MWKDRRVLITGATGLLGSHLTQRLLQAGADIVCIVRDAPPKSLFFSSEPDWNLVSKVTVVRGDINNFDLVERAVNEYEIQTVFHLAAQAIVKTANLSPLETFRTNILGTAHVLEACRQQSSLVKQVIIASSDKAYGNLSGKAYDESYPLRGEHPYDVSKSCADLIANTYFKSYGLPVATTRCGNFYGPGDLNFNRIIPGAIRDICRGQRPVIRSDGKFIRDYIFAADGAAAYVLLAERMMENPNLHGEAFNFSYEMRLKVVDVVGHVLRLMKSPLEPKILNEAKNEIPEQSLNSTKAREVLGWKPAYGFEEGLKLTIDWYQRILGA